MLEEKLQQTNPPSLEDFMKQYFGYMLKTDPKFKYSMNRYKGVKPNLPSKAKSKYF